MHVTLHDHGLDTVMNHLRVVMWLLTMMALLVVAGYSLATPLPPNAIPLLPVLKKEILQHWPGLNPRSTLGALVEQESCVSLKSKRCWSPRAELKTDREYGFGLGQITITKRFNVWEETKRMDPSLRDWQWDDRYRADYQLRGIVIKNRNTYAQMSKLTPRRIDRLSFTFSAYNGGAGGLIKDRTLCSKTKGCDPTRWSGHVELTSFKSRTVVKGYGKSFYTINREYVKNIMSLLPRRQKYVAALDS